MEVSGQLHNPRKEPLVPIKQESVWAPGTIWMRWRREKNPFSVLPRIESWRSSP